MYEKLSIDYSILGVFAFYSAILAIKMQLMAPLTAYYRFKNKAFCNPEDMPKDKPGSKKAKLNSNDPDVERIKRIHRNDMENLPIFWILGLLYSFTRPDLAVATWVFRVFTICRLSHTIFYFKAVGIFRGISFIIGEFINIYLAGSIILTLL